MWSQAAFDQSKAVAEVELTENLNSLRKSLSDAGYDVRIQKPPVEGAYGLVNIKKKTIWIAPIAKEMGIFRTTFIHESVHAAQACKTGEFEPIGWDLEVDEAVRVSIESILYRQYPSNKFDIEMEAFLMQGQPDAITRIQQVLKEYC
jgi:hypothetical protein